MKGRTYSIPWSTVILWDLASMIGPASCMFNQPSNNTMSINIFVGSSSIIFGVNNCATNGPSLFSLPANDQYNQHHDYHCWHVEYSDKNIHKR